MFAGSLSIYKHTAAITCKCRKILMKLQLIRKVCDPKQLFPYRLCFVKGNSFFQSSVSLFHESSCSRPFLNGCGIFQKSTCSYELCLDNVFDRYLDGIELKHSSNYSHLLFYYKRTTAVTHSFKVTVFCRTNCIMEISQLLIMIQPCLQEFIY